VGDALVGDALVGDALVGATLVGDAEVGTAVVGDALVGDTLVGDVVVVVGDAEVGVGVVGNTVAVVGAAEVGTAVVGDALVGDAVVGDGAVGTAGAALVPTVMIGSKEKPCSAYSATPLPKKGVRRSTSVLPSESRVCTMKAARTSPASGQLLPGESVTAYAPLPACSADSTRWVPTLEPAVPCVTDSAGMPPLRATSKLTSVFCVAGALVSSYILTDMLKSLEPPAVSALVVMASRKRYFFASALSRYTASFCLNWPSCVGSSCDCCHEQRALPSYAAGRGPVPCSSSTDARRTSLMSKTQSPLASPKKVPLAIAPAQHEPSAARARRASGARGDGTESPSSRRRRPPSTA
jgi:hypothetical protein